MFLQLIVLYCTSGQGGASFFTGTGPDSLNFIEQFQPFQVVFGGVK